MVISYKGNYSIVSMFGGFKGMYYICKSVKEKHIDNIRPPVGHEVTSALLFKFLEL